jgi:hypothetical protein
VLLRPSPSECFFSDGRTLVENFGFQPTLQAVEAVNTLLEATPGTPSYMIGISENKITRVPLMDAVEMVRFCRPQSFEQV